MTPALRTWLSGPKPDARGMKGTNVNTNELNMEDLGFLRTSLRLQALKLADKAKEAASEAGQTSWRRISRRLLEMAESLADGATMITSERRRQVTDERWSAEHDDTHKDGELLAAALHMFAPESNHWPWGANGEPPAKHKDWSQIKRLVVGAAFVAAEIDRLLRAECMAQRTAEPTQ